jgi:hypothetical protein
MSTIIKIAGRVALVLGGWVLIMLILPFVGPAGRDVVIVGDSARAVRAVAAASGRIIDVRRHATVARSDQPGFAFALYRNGAPLVLEGRIAAGCLGLRTSP